MTFKYKWVFLENTHSLLSKKLPNKLKNRFGYKDLVCEKDFIYAPGQIPVLLVAHVDIVHPEIFKNKIVLYDDRVQMLWSPQGLGADDRAGVSAILELLERGSRPHVLFCDLEERGGTGAKSASKSLSNLDIRYIIEMDRKGDNDAVFYNCENKDFKKYVEKFGWKSCSGSFSDISILCPAWKIAGVNLSIGYYDPHNKTEYLNVYEWFNSIETVEAMMCELPETSFEYIGFTCNRAQSLYDWEDSYGSYDSEYGSYGKWKGSSYKKEEKTDFPKKEQLPIIVPPKTASDKTPTVYTPYSSSDKFMKHFKEYKEKDDLPQMEEPDLVLQVQIDFEDYSSAFGGSLASWSKLVFAYGEKLVEKMEDYFYIIAETYATEVINEEEVGVV